MKITENVFIQISASHCLPHPLLLLVDDHFTLDIIARSARVNATVTRRRLPSSTTMFLQRATGVSRCVSSETRPHRKHMTANVTLKRQSALLRVLVENVMLETDGTHEALGAD
jgi:hypothetical protein